MGVIFITGIDAECGKTMATGLIARFLSRQKKSVITQKLVQTGCEDKSDDILMHRKIMGMDLSDDDKNGLTCPYIFKFPASPRLSAKLERKSISIDSIGNATKELSDKYDTVLIEGVGGLFVPLNDTVMLLDYIEMHNYPVIVTASSKSGSVNHTLLTLDAIAKRDLDVNGIILNHYPGQDKVIVEDSRDIFERYLSQQWFTASIIDIPVFDMNSIPDIDFTSILRN